MSHEPKVHCRADELAVEGQVHPAHGEEGSEWNAHDHVDVLGVLLARLDELRRGVIVWDVEPEAMGNLRTTILEKDKNGKSEYSSNSYADARARKVCVFLTAVGTPSLQENGYPRTKSVPSWKGSYSVLKNFGVDGVKRLRMCCSRALIFSPLGLEATCPYTHAHMFPPTPKKKTKVTTDRDRRADPRLYGRRRPRTYKAVVVDGVDVLFLRHQESKASARRVFERDAGCLVAQHALDVVSVVNLIVEALSFQKQPALFRKGEEKKRKHALS